MIKLVYSVLGQAVNEGASDIHFEPGEDEMRVRFRVDGVLYEAARVPKRMVPGGGLADQDHERAGHRREARRPRTAASASRSRTGASTCASRRCRPSAARASTIRILDKDNALRTLDDLGIDGKGRKRFEDSFHQAYGAVVVTGPTGSGKSTTLYAALEVLNEVEKNIITIEDPVEYRLAGINQINVNRKAGLDFATGLRSILRADPDIIMVGEIRDAETARIAIEAALTGHMVLTTLHTNDAPGAITRLAEDGDRVVPHRLRGRLRRRPAAGPQALPPLQDSARRSRRRCSRRSGFKVRRRIEAYEPVGCARCNQTGYKGRTGLFSVMVVSETIKDMVVNLASEAEIAKQASAEEGMLTLREDGLAKVRAGLTSIEEVVRVTS